MTCSTTELQQQLEICKAGENAIGIDQEQAKSYFAKIFARKYGIISYKYLQCKQILGRIGRMDKRESTPKSQVNINLQTKERRQAKKDRLAEALRENLRRRKTAYQFCPSEKNEDGSGNQSS